MNYAKQQDIENISVEALLQCVEAGNHDIEQFNNENSAICLQMKSTIDDHRQAVSQLIDSISILAKNRFMSFDEVKSKLEKLCTTQSEFYEREHRKCCYGFKECTYRIKSEEEHGSKENILLHSIHDTLDKRIKEYQRILSSQQQQQ